MPDRSRPRPSVVIPLFNKRDLVLRAVDSVLSQTWRNLDLVVVDDGSTDGSAEQVGRIQDRRLRLLRQANAGPGAARNAGWRASDGPIVAFLDADDHWRGDYLEWAVSTLAEHGEAAACTSGYAESTRRGTISPGERYWSARGLRPGVFRLVPDTAIETFAAALTYMFPVTTTVRREVLQAYGGFFEDPGCTYGDDSFLWIRVLLNHAVFLDFTPRVTVDRTGSSLSTLATLAHRSLEPILARADAVRACCPPELAHRLERLLALKACKRACTLAAVGRWAEGRRLRSKFGDAAPMLDPYCIASRALTNPAGSVAASFALRALQLIRAH